MPMSRRSRVPATRRCSTDPSTTRRWSRRSSNNRVSKVLVVARSFRQVALKLRPGDDEGDAPELADHAVDVPKAVDEHDAVVGLAVARDVALRLAKQPGGVNHSSSSCAGLLFAGFTPLARVVDALANDQSRGDDGRLHIGGPHASR